MLEAQTNPPEIHPHRLWLWGGLVLVIIVGGVWYVSQQFLIEEEIGRIETDNQQVIVPVKSKTASSTIDASNWKTYRNEEYGFELKNPDGWELQELFDDSAKSRKLLAVSVSKNSSRFSIFPHGELDKGYEDMISREFNINFAERSARQIVFFNEETTAARGFEIILFKGVVPKNWSSNNRLEIVYPPNFRKNVEEVLNTFHFL